MKPKTKKALVYGIGGLAAVGLFLGLALSGGDANAAPLPPEPEPPKPPDPGPKPPDPQPDPPKPDIKPPQPEPKPGEPLPFDLTNNWGGLPMDVRADLARIELAARIPGLGRALAVKAWQAFRAGKALVAPSEAKAIAEANPNLARTFLNKGDAAASLALLEKNTKPKSEGGAGWPKPKDFSGWAAGSYGLFDILGASAAHAGIHQGFTPLVDEPSAAAAMATWRVQGFVAAYIVWRFLFSDIYSVLVPGVNAPNGNSLETWANIFSAWAGPANYVKQNAESKAARQRYIDRAGEIGIDLSKVAYPWPPGTSYKPEVWQAKGVWQRLGDYMSRPVVDTQGGGVQPEPPPVDIKEPKPGEQLGAAIDLGNGLKAYQRGASIDGPAPLIVVMHGRGGDETALLAAMPDLPGVRVFFLRGQLPGKDGGRVFYEARLTDPDNVVAPLLVKGGDQVAQGLRQLQKQYPTTQVGAVGFSQGAAVALYLATLGAVDWVYSHAGALPASLRPRHPQAVRVVQWHGEDDLVVPIDMDIATADAFADARYPLPIFVEGPKSGHRVFTPQEVKNATEKGVPYVDLEDPIATGVYIEKGTCAMQVSDAGLAVLAMCQAIIPTARQLAPVDGSELRQMVDAFLGELAPYCLLGDKPWKDSTSALRGYLAVRGMLRALVGRGLLAAGEATSLLNDVRAGALKAGAQADLLPALGVA